MTDQVPNLYHELGVAPDASDDDLRAEYRRQARRLHPDVADEATTGDAMRRLNQAWAVLGDPERRRRYDQERAGPLVAGDVAGDVDGDGAADPRAPRDDWPDDHMGPRPLRLRPSWLILLVLAAIFVVTAYAGSWPGNQSGPTGSTRSPGSTAVVAGQCLANQARAIVACSEPNQGQILAQVAAVDQCPAGTIGQLLGQGPTVVCIVAGPRPSR